MSDAAKTRRASYGQPYYDKYAGKTSGGEQKEEETKVGYSRQKVVDLALSWVGKKESDGSYKSIIDIYNTLPTAQLPRKTKMQYGWAWCACTWSALAIKLGYTAIMPLEISCYYLIENAKKMGCWVEADNYVPSPGDAILYDWADGSNYASYDNTAGPDHVGTVVSVNKSAGTFVVVEGNMSNAIGTRTMAVNGRYIRGFITPKYDNNTVTPSTGTGTGSAGGQTAQSLKVGDIVQFSGSKHYTSANAASGKTCTPGKAKITQIYQLGKSKHPYHLIAEKGGGSNVYGWVDAADIGQKTGSTVTAQSTRTYTVKKGDSLWAIAAKQLGNGSRYKEIKDLNGLKSDTIYAEQVLKLPE
ncbi:LysM peptidoglycan-binding domain-containing protein [Fusobacterium naviforme]|nr:LysM peptidoglycan-binding domain-containing protein [Fusobacterium naviforme]